MRRPVITIAVLLFAASLSAQSLPELFQKAKAQVKGESWSEGLRTLEKLEVESAKPGNETARPQLEAPMAFYRGVCEANLGMAEQAQADFEAFLALQPNASMDPSMYSKKAIEAFRVAQKKAAPPDSSTTSGPRCSSRSRNSGCRPIPESRSANCGPTVPIQWIMTEEEKRSWQSLAFADERLEFAERFWESRNPKPGNPDNSYRNTFERRVAFADANFVQAEGTRGSMTDRGMVFVLLGPPSWIGKKPIRHGEAEESGGGMSLVGSRGTAYAQRTMAAAGQPASGPAAADALFGPWVRSAEVGESWREVWHYRRELLPGNVRYQLVDVEFITKKGYGVGMLQRDPAAVATLEAARDRFTDR